MVSTRVTPNAEPIKVNVVGSSNFGIYDKISPERTYNMFVSTAGKPDSDDFEAWMINFPGYRRVLDILPYPNPYPSNPPLLPSQVPQGSGRGIYNCVRGNFAMVVVNNVVYRIDFLSTGLFQTQIGMINTSAGEVFMADNLANQICLVDGKDCWIYFWGNNAAPNLTKQTNGALGSGALIPNYVEYHNTFFLFGNGNKTSSGAAWYAYSPAEGANLGALTVLGTGVLAATELVINGVDLANTYTSAASFVNYINTGLVGGVTAVLTGSSVSLQSVDEITVVTAGTVSTDGINFANFDLTSGSQTVVFNTTLDTAITQTSMLALETKSDFAIAVKKIPGQGNNVIVFGESVAEIHTQVGGLLNYIRNQTKNINYGCQSVSTIADSGDVLAWLGINETDAAVIMIYDTKGFRQISTDGISFILDQIVAPQSSTGTLYKQNGHLFYQLTFYDPRDNVTFAYDFDTDMFFNLTDQYLNYHPARQVIYINQNSYFISLNSAALYQMSSNFTTIDENLYPLTPLSVYNQGLVFDMQFMRITSSVRQANSQRFIANSFVMTLEQGVDPYFTGASAEQNNRLITEALFVPPLTPMINEPETLYLLASNIPGIDDPYFSPTIPYVPHIDMAISKDGGVTWSNYVRRNMHTLGNRQNILHWEGMGAANDLCFKLRFWTKGRIVVNNAQVDVIS